MAYSVASLPNDCSGPSRSQIVFVVVVLLAFLELSMVHKGGGRCVSKGLWRTGVEPGARKEERKSREAEHECVSAKDDI